MREGAYGLDDSEVLNKIRNIEGDEAAVQIEQSKDEGLSVPESNAAVHPRTMMVHVQNTGVASRAMMRSVWLEQIADNAVPLSCFA